MVPQLREWLVHTFPGYLDLFARVPNLAGRLPAWGKVRIAGHKLMAGPIRWRQSLGVSMVKRLLHSSRPRMAGGNRRLRFFHRDNGLHPTSGSHPASSKSTGPATGKTGPTTSSCGTTTCASSSPATNSNSLDKEEEIEGIITNGVEAELDSIVK